MADKKLESITFPGLQDRYVVKPDIADVTGLQTALDGKADTNGTYDDMTVGNAEQLVSNVLVEDKVPYQFRTAGGSVDIGKRAYFDAIVGGTVAWNQLAKYNARTGTTGGLSYTINADGSVVFSEGTTTGVVGLNADVSFTGKLNHVLYIGGCPSGGADGKYYVRDGYASGASNLDIGSGKIIKKTQSDNLIAQIYINTGITIPTLTFKPQIVDLTQMFGSTIADYIYSLEQATAGAGVAFFRKYFPNSYYPYNAGELVSVSGLSAHKTTGFNQFDKTTATHGKRFAASGKVIADRATGSVSDYIRVAPNTVYYAKDVSGSGQGNTIVFFDSDKVWIGTIDIGSSTKESGTFTTPSDCGYIRFQYETVNEDTVCINLSWDGSRDGEYEEYKEHTYPLDDSLTLRGIPKLVDGKLQFDGDEYEPDGTVSRKYGIVDLGTLNWTKESLSGGKYRFVAGLVGARQTVNASTIPNAITPVAEMITPASSYSGAYGASMAHNSSTVFISGSDYDSMDATDFKSAMSGKYLTYELLDSYKTTEEADAYSGIQIVDDFGTEEFVTTAIIPVGHVTHYPVNLVAKLEMMPNSPDGSGEYIVTQSGGINEYTTLASSSIIENIINRIEALENA